MSENFRGFITDDLAPMVARIQADYEAYLSLLPEYVAQAVIKFAPPGVFVSTGRLSVMALPFWVGKAFGVEPETRYRIALANIFGLLHFVTQDSLTDGDFTEADMPARVVSGTLFQQQMFTHYQRCFPSQSPFWSLVDKYWLEWATSIAWERQIGVYSPFTEENLLLAARKAAPLKISTSGLALLGNRENLIPDLERAVDLMHMVMQMADDFGDLAEDFAANRFNTLLSTMISTGALDPQANPDINQIGRTILIERVDEIHFQRMWTISEEVQTLLGEMGLTKWAKLIVQMVQWMEKWRDEQLRDFLSEMSGVLEKLSQQQLKPVESRVERDIDRLLSNLSLMRKSHPDYSPGTAREILNAIPEAYSMHCTEGGRWGPGFIARVAHVTSPTVGRYLKAFKENELIEINGIPIP